MSYVTTLGERPDGESLNVGPEARGWSDMVGMSRGGIWSPAEVSREFPPWIAGKSALDVMDDAAARMLTRRLRDDRLRRAVTAVVASALEESGYEGLTYPDLARRAGVAVTDLKQIFPSKAELVAAAVGRGTWTVSPFALPGREIVVRYLAFWERDDNALILRELLRATFRDRRLAAALERHVIGAVIRPFAERDQSTDAYPRARLVFSHLVGLAMSRYVLEQEPLASADCETLAAWVGPSLDHYLHGELGQTLATAG